MSLPHKYQTIYLLLGLKGSGKTYIGERMKAQYGIHFIRVEDIVKSLKGNRSHKDPEFQEEAFTAIEHSVREALKSHKKVVFESTGLTPFFKTMLANLEADFKVKKVNVMADAETCLERIKARDASIHIPFSEQEIVELNKEIKALQIPHDHTISNDGNQQHMEWHIKNMVTSRDTDEFIGELEFDYITTHYMPRFDEEDGLYKLAQKKLYQLHRDFEKDRLEDSSLAKYKRLAPVFLHNLTHLYHEGKLWSGACDGVQFSKDSPEFRQLAEILNTPVEIQDFWMCSPVYRDLFLFHDQSGQVVEALHVCFECSYMENGSGADVRADRTTYSKLYHFLADVGNKDKPIKLRADPFEDESYDPIAEASN